MQTEAMHEVRGILQLQDCMQGWALSAFTACSCVSCATHSHGHLLLVSEQIWTLAEVEMPVAC